MPVINSKAPELQDISGWVNGEAEGLEDGTYLLDFWTYSCVNCVRMLPLMQRIHEAYPEVTVLGIHTPEFDFERERENVEQAVERHGLEYPIALDSENSTWQAYGNQYWPRQTLVHDGKIVWQHIGESSLHDLEDRIVEVLDIESRGIDLEHETRSDVSPETYLGYRRCNGVNEDGVFRGERTLEAPTFHVPEKVYLEGTWSMENEYLEAVKDSKLFYSFDAREVNAVLHPAGGVKDLAVKVDGSYVDEKDAGRDLRFDGEKSFVRVKRPGLYNLLETDRREAEIMLLPERKTRLYTLTFG
ncbi:MAG: redoxin family protein [Candidatus Nanohaloarchaea archaeon]